MVGVNVPAEVGVPLITPVDALMLNPDGRLEALQKYGVTPPLAAIVEEYELPALPPGRDAVVMENDVPTHTPAEQLPLPKSLLTVRT